jgi:uncharacterized protein (DUF2249 family)
VIDDFDPAVVTDLDVRELIARGLQPLPLILEMADGLEPGRVLHIRSPFQPNPLYGVLGERGFEHRFACFAEDDWSSWFWRADQPPRRAPALAVTHLGPPEGVTDLRWLAPPEPLLWVMQWVSAPTGPSLRVMLPFFPTPLPALIAESGWSVRTELERDDGVVVVIERRES